MLHGDMLKARQHLASNDVGSLCQFISKRIQSPFLRNSGNYLLQLVNDGERHKHESRKAIIVMTLVADVVNKR